MRKKMVILSGPSGIGKSPLLKAFKRHHPGVKYCKLVLTTSRPPRPDERHGIDFYFESRGLIGMMGNDRNFITGPVRTDLQAIDMCQLEEILGLNDLVIADMYPTLGTKVAEWQAKYSSGHFDTVTIGMVPGTMDEIAYQAALKRKTPQLFILDLIAYYQILRGDSDKAKIADRAKSAYAEIEMMADYTHHLINHTPEGEASSVVAEKMAWDDPLDEEPARVLKEFAEIVLA